MDETISSRYWMVMPKDAFSHVTTWVFDLDNTLYPPEARLFDQIEERMTTWVMEALGLERAAANQLRKDYWATYGTTLAGLMREHDVDPGPYLTHVHEITLDHLAEDPALTIAIRNPPGRCIVFTNGTAPYAERVISARGLSGLFDAVYGVEHTGFLPKPERAAFEAIIMQDGFAPDCAAMFEDDPRNLAEPHSMGMKTVHVAALPEDFPHVHYHTDDLGGFLAQLT